MPLPAIPPQQAQRLIRDGAILIDIREADEHARLHIPGAQPLPASMLDDAPLATPPGAPVIFHCRSGMRTTSYADRLASKVGSGCQAFIIDGGLDAWKKAGLPVKADHRQPIELQRQMQIAAGSMALAGTLLGYFVSAGFYFIPGFVGTGLLVAGLTGFCGMARLLTFAPWNRLLRQASGPATQSRCAAADCPEPGRRDGLPAIEPR